MSPGAGDAPLLAVVVPTLDEERHLPRLLDDLQALRVSHEVVVVDGGSTDATIRVARRFGARVIRAPRGRGAQMAAGAGSSTAPWLFFLHADSGLSPATVQRVERWLGEAGPRDAAHLGFALDGTGWFWRFIEFGQALRERLTGLVYGDQGLLVSRALYEDVGGFPPLPIMEDVSMVSRLRRRGRLQRLDAPLLTSPRRYRREGRWRTWLRNIALITLFRLGLAPGRLARFYRPAVGVGTPPADLLLVFAKAPRPGTVKTRLAAGVGEASATEIYRRMGRRIVDALRHGPWRTVVAYAPADARAEVADWLGSGGLEFRAQEGRGLGARMSEAFRWAFREADRVCVVGTDAPDVDEALVRRAFHLLDDHDLALGPARDGGYYLLAMRQYVPGLFRDMPWSTSRVLAITRERAAQAGLSVAHLPELVDVDTVDDLPANGR